MEAGKKEWTCPQLSELNLEETEGLGGGGSDFGSELS